VGEVADGCADLFVPVEPVQGPEHSSSDCSTSDAFEIVACDSVACGSEGDEEDSRAAGTAASDACAAAVLV
jgi:hypothetical protein